MIRMDFMRAKYLQKFDKISIIMAQFKFHTEKARNNVQKIVFNEMNPSI